LDSLLRATPLDLEVMEVLVRATENCVPCVYLVLGWVSIWRVVRIVNTRYSMIM